MMRKFTTFGLSCLLTLSLCAHLAQRAAAATITISSQNVNGWQYGGTTATLKLFANQDFLTAEGEFVKQGNPNTGLGFFRSYSCTVTGSVLSIPAITNLPTTTDSPDVPSAKWTARFYDYRSTARDYWMVNFKFSHTSASPQTWATIRIYNVPPGPQPPSTYPTTDQVAVMINSAISGASALFPVGIGTVTLTNGQATVAFASMTSSARVQLTGQDDHVSGTLRVSAITVGVGFTITSSNGADNGNVFWSVYKP